MRAARPLMSRMMVSRCGRSQSARSADNNLLTAYAHNKTLLVKEGEPVTKGQKIAEAGQSDSDRPKLHFEVRKQGKPVDPMDYLPAR